MVSGTDDLPNAYRGVPIAPADLDVNVVEAVHPSTLQPWYFVVWAALFGFSASVIQFGRLSSFLQAVCRRMAQVMSSLYVDDA